MFDIKLQANEVEIPLDNLIRKIVRATPPSNSSPNPSPFGGHNHALRESLANLKREDDHTKRIEKLIENEVASGRLKIINKDNRKVVLIWDLVKWTNYYGKLVEQAAYPGQLPYVHDCYARLRKEHNKPNSCESNKNNTEPSTDSDTGIQKQSTVRKQPNGGDSITSLIWEVCYDFLDKNKKISAMPVMAELQTRAQSKDAKLRGPLTGVTSEGVNYLLFENGDQKELLPEQLRARIREWRRITKIG